MKVVVRIDGREALPVRAIPFLTDWDKWYPDVLSAVFAGDAAGRGLAAPGAVATFRLESGRVVSIEPRWWANFAIEQLAALDQRLEESRGRSSLGRDEWRLQALEVLPAEAFVWLDDFRAFHERDWRLRARVFAASAGAFPDWIKRLQELGWGESEMDSSDEEHLVDAEAEPLSADLLSMMKEGFDTLLRVHKLDLSPLIPKAFRDLVAEALNVEADPRQGGAAVLAPAEVEEIKQRLAAGQSVNSLAKQFNVSRPTIDKFKAPESATYATGLGQRKAR